MKEVLVPIDKAGRIVLPKEIREELAIDSGDMLRVTVIGNQITLLPSKEVCGFIERGKALIFSTGKSDLLDNETVENVRNLARSQALRGISKGLPIKRRE